jgi:telomere length regulation protein
MFYKNDMQKQVAWKELLSLIAASRVLSTAAEALSLASESEFRRLSWLGNGSQYASWLGANICHMTSKLAATGQEEQWRALASLIGRALSLGYTGNLLNSLLSLVVLSYLHRSSSERDILGSPRQSATHGTIRCAF